MFAVAIIFAILILTASGALGIYLSRKNITIRNFLSKNNTIFFAFSLSAIVFFIKVKTSPVIFSIAYTFGYVFLFSTFSSFLAVLIMSNFKLKKDEIWPAWFMTLIWVLVILIYDHNL